MCEGYLYSHSYTKDNSAYSLTRQLYYRFVQTKTKKQQQLINRFYASVSLPSLIYLQVSCFRIIICDR